VIEMKLVQLVSLQENCKHHITNKLAANNMQYKSIVKLFRAIKKGSEKHDHLDTMHLQSP
jgi:hypothetical protein